MPTTASVRRKPANTLEDLETWETGTVNDRIALDNIHEVYGFTGGKSNVVHLDAYRDGQLTGAFDEEREQIDKVGLSKPENQEQEVSWASYTHPREQKYESSQEFIRITRAIFMKSILQALDEIQPYVKTPDASLYVHDILHKIQEFEETSPNNPFLEILSGVYVALAFENQWMDYEAKQYTGIRKLLKTFAERSTLKSTDIEKAIMKMEEIGFDTTPIPIFPGDFDE